MLEVEASNTQEIKPSIAEKLRAEEEQLRKIVTKTMGMYGDDGQEPAEELPEKIIKVNLDEWARGVIMAVNEVLKHNN